jgi:hypothetical protein
MRVSTSETDNDWERGGPHRFLLTEVYVDPEIARQTYQSRTTANPGNLPESAAAGDVVTGQKIRRTRGAQDKAFWISNDRMVLVTFAQSSGANEAFPAERLSYFPSSM